MPPGLRKVRYITDVNVTALKEIIKTAIQNPKTCDKFGE